MYLQYQMHGPTLLSFSGPWQERTLNATLSKVMNKWKSYSPAGNLNKLAQTFQTSNPNPCFSASHETVIWEVSENANQS